jgi:hypothetical protein
MLMRSGGPREWRAAASRIGALELPLSKLAGALADADHMRRSGPVHVGKSPEAGAYRDAISWCASNSGRGEVPETQVEAR